MKKGLLLVSAVVLFLACGDIQVDYSFYQILRWLVTITAGIWAFNLYNKVQFLFAICCIITVLFNPIAPIYLNKSAWSVIDIVVGTFFLYLLLKNKKI